MRFLLPFLLLLTSAVAAQPETRNLGEIPAYDQVQQSIGLRSYNALIHHHEWALPQESLLSISNAYTFLQPGRPLDGFLAHLYQPGQQFSLGSQALQNATPIYEQFLFQGGRWGGHQNALSGGLFFGQTQNVLEELRGSYARQQVAGASLGWNPDDFHSYGLSVMPYASKPYGGIDRVVGMAQLYQGQEFQDGGSYGVSLGYGRDSASSNSAFRVLGQFHNDWLEADFAVRSMGAGFGPPTGAFDLRGTSFSNFTGTVHLSPEWSFLESANLSDTSMGTPQSSHLASFSHSLRYQSEDLSVVAGLQQFSQSSAGQRSSTNSYFLSASGQWDRVRVNGTARHSTGFFNSDELGLGLAFPLSDWLSLRLQEYYSGSGGALSTNAGLAFNLGQLGSAEIGYYRQDQLQSTVFRQARRDSFLANAQLNLLGNLKFRASVNPQSFSQLQLRWIADEHQEFVLEHRVQNQDNRFFYNDFTSVPFAHVTSLSWNASWGGPLEKRLRGELESKVRVRVFAQEQEESAGVREVRLQLGELQAVTDQEGYAYFGHLPAGPHRLQVFQVPENYELLVPELEPLELEPGRTQEVSILARAHCGLELVTFQDQNADGHVLGLDYTPVPQVSVLVNDERFTSDAEGKIRLHRLPPGGVRVSLDASSLEPGLEMTTPVTQEVQLRPGVTRRVEFGLRGFGRLRLDVLEYLPGAVSEVGARPAANIGLLLHSSRIGETDLAGHFEGKVPSGMAQLRADLSDGAGQVEVRIPVNGTPSATLICYRFARLRVAVQGLPADAGLGIRLVSSDGSSPGPVYVGHMGHEFSRLKPGIYKLLVEEETLPEHFRCESVPATIRLGSGQVSTWKLNLVEEK